MAEQQQRGILLSLAAEGVIPVLGGCAGALAGGPEIGILGGAVGIAVGQTLERVINFFGVRIVSRWSEWFRHQPAEVRERALAELAQLDPEQARQQASQLLDDLILEPVDPADKELAITYLSLLPGALDRALPRELNVGLRSLPATISYDEPAQLLSLMPRSLPPYPVGSEVPGTPYRLEALLGSGGFGAVYRASTHSLQHLPLAIKFCLDPTLAQSLQRERANLERLMKAGGQDWSSRIVRLYGYDLEHPTPYLVYEFVTGGDLIRHVAEQRERLSRSLNHDEVLDLITQLTEALAFAHEHGLVHRDVKPANVLVENGILKLADFGLGGVTAARATQVSRIGATTVDTLSAADQASLFRGAGTPLYVSPEQRRGQPPDPRHDLYSLGVMWYQLLVGDVSRELHPGWAKELTLRYRVPRSHVELIDCCVDFFEERPKNAAVLLQKIRQLGKSNEEAVSPEVEKPAPTGPTGTPVVSSSTPTRSLASEEMRQSLLQAMIKRLHVAHEKLESARSWNWVAWPLGIAVVGIMIVGTETRAPWIMVFFGIGFCAVAAWYVRYWREGNAELLFHELLRELVREFPQQVADWGGEAALKNPEMVAKIGEQLGVIQRPDPAQAALPSLSKQERKALIGRLESLAESIDRSSQSGSRKPYHWLIAIVLSLVIGAPIGTGIAFAYDALNSPVSYRGNFNGEFGQLYFNNRSVRIDRAVYLREQNTTGATSILLGLGSGIAIAGMVFTLLIKRPWHRVPLFVGGVAGLVVGGGIGVGVGFGHHFYGGPIIDQVDRVMRYYDARGQEMDVIQYVLESRRVITYSALFGVGIGLATCFSLALFVERWYERRVQRLRREIDLESERIQNDYPALTATVGGAMGLKDFETVHELVGRLR